MLEIHLLQNVHLLCHNYFTLQLQIPRRNWGSRCEPPPSDHTYAALSLPRVKQSAASETSPADILFYTAITADVFEGCAKAVSATLKSRQLGIATNYS